MMLRFSSWALLSASDQPLMYAIALIAGYGQAMAVATSGPCFAARAVMRTGDRKRLDPKGIVLYSDQIYTKSAVIWN